MTTKYFAAELRDLIREVRDENGISEIKCDNLIAYLEQVISSPEEEITPAQMEEYKAKLQVWISQHDVAHDREIETFRAVNLAGQNALKTAFLMNGGATVALLAFLGKLSDQYQDKIAVFASAMLFFVFGVLVVAVATGATYLVGYCPNDSEPNKLRWRFWRDGRFWNAMAIALGLASYALFSSGAILAYRAFLGFTK